MLGSEDLVSEDSLGLAGYTDLPTSLPTFDGTQLPTIGPRASAPHPLRGRWVSAAVVAAALLVGAVSTLALRGTSHATTRTPTNARHEVPAAGGEPQTQDSALASTVRARPALGEAPAKAADLAPPAAASPAASNPVAKKEEVLPVAVPEAQAQLPTLASSPLSALKNEPSTANRVASLDVVVFPFGAYVSLDGQPPVKAPTSFSELKAGAHTVRRGMDASALGRTERVRLKPGANRVRFELVANPFETAAKAN
jgi:hypothetical protein